MEFSLDMNIKLGEKNHKHVAIVSIREPESGEYAEFYGTVSPGGSMGPELTQFVLREIESWISLKQDGRRRPRQNEICCEAAHSQPAPGRHQRLPERRAGR